MRKTKEAKRIETAAAAAFKKHGSGVQVNIMDIGKILSAGENAGALGGDRKGIEAAVVDALAKYRLN